MSRFFILAVLLVSGCPSKSEVQEMRNARATSLVATCEAQTSSLSYGAHTDECVAYWLRKIAEKK